MLLTAVIIASIAAAPAVLSKPDPPTVSATAAGGEVLISWSPVPGARYYTVGWINWTDGQPVSAAGGDWLSFFNYTTVPGNVTSYTVKGQDGGDDHYAIIRATDDDDRFGGGYSPWSDWSVSPAQPAGQHGAGFCPVTGLPMPSGGYSEIGDTLNWEGYRFGVASVETPRTIRFVRGDGTRYDREPPAGRRWLRVNLHMDNQSDMDVTLRPREHVLITDRGIAFTWSGDRVLESGRSHPDGTFVSYDIPEDATAAVLAIRPFIHTAGTSATEPSLALFRIPIPAPTAASGHETVVFGDLNWHSALLQNRIAQYIVEFGYDYPTKVRFGSTLPLFQGLRRGDIQVLMELWLPNQEEAWSAGLAAGEVVSLGGSLGKDWQSAFVIPAYVQQQYPGLDSVEDLKNPQYRQLFATAETAGKARLVSCVVGWACEDDNAAQVEGYGLSDHVHIVNPSSGAALDEDLHDAYERGDPWLGYQWGTNGPALLLELVRLEEPAYTNECWRTTRACAYEEATVLIAETRDLPNDAPKVAEMFRNWDFSIDAVYRKIVRWQDVNPSADTEAAALWWLNNGGNIWEQWVTDEAASSIRSALAAGEIPSGWPGD